MSTVSDKIKAMREGGRALGKIKAQLAAFAQPGKSFADIEDEAQRLIAQAGMKPSFSTVAGYDWATCIMKNDQLCHGIPTPDKVVREGDIVTIDVGLINQGYHLDTTTTVAIEPVSAEIEKFLTVGKKALNKAIAKVKPGASVYDVSYAMQQTVEKAGYDAVTQLTGHGVGEELHMEPSIPCVAVRGQKRVKLTPGQTIAVEIMYAQGSAQLTLDKDGWTYKTIDGSLSGMFEETILVTERGHEVLTAS